MPGAVTQVAPVFMEATAGLQEEGAKSFVKSWTGLLEGIAAKSAVLRMANQAGRE